MRHANPRSFLALAVFGFAPAFAACSSNGQASKPNGPVYGNDSGSDSSIDYPPEASLSRDATADHATLKDAPTEADVTTLDAHPGGDAKLSPEAGMDTGTPDSPVESEASVDATSSMDASDASRSVDASACPNGMGTLALLGGTSSLAFGATSRNGGAWVLTSFTGQNVGATPALVPFGTGFLGVFSTSANSDIESTVFAPTATPTWTAPSGIPALTGSDASATESGPPALAVLGGTAQLVYAGSDFKFYHGSYDGTTWSPASDPVGGAGASHEFGPSTPTAAVSGSTLFMAYDGGNHGLYVDSWTAASGWAGASGVTGAGVAAVPPKMIALKGGTADLMLVFEVPTTNLLFSVVHTAGTWSSPAQVGPTANTQRAVSLAPLAGGGAVVVYLGSTDSFAYASIYNPTATPPWTTPVPVYPNSLPLQSPPTVAAGVCGVDAVAALVEAAGVEIVTLTGSAWSSPVLVGGTASMTYATIATAP